jgi:DNA-binding Lrp family transcriptional regulator
MVGVMFVLVKSKAGRLEEVRERISRLPRVWEVNYTAGKNDILVELRGENLEELFDILFTNLEDIPFIDTTLAVPCWGRGVFLQPHAQNLPKNLQTLYVLIMADRGTLHSIKDRMLYIPQVIEVAYVAGSYDLVAVLKGNDLSELLRIQFKQVLKIPGIVSSETLVGIV